MYGYNIGYKLTQGALLNVPVESISLNESEVLGGIADTVQLTATVLPANAGDKSVTWSSDDETVATVSSSGLVTFVARGSCTITVTTTDGSFTDTCDAYAFQTDFKDDELSSAEVDAVLDELASARGLTYLATLPTPTIDLRGNDARTSGSDTDYETLIAAGVQILEDAVDAAFKLTVDTTKAGSANDTFVLPLYNSAGIDYNFDIDWGDGNSETYADTGFNLGGDVSHQYTTSGTYQVAITENVAGGFSRIDFNGGGDCLKVMSLDNWGTIVWGITMISAFKGLSNMVANYSDIPNFSNVQVFQEMLRDCDLFNGSFAGTDMSSSTSFYAMLRNANAYKQPLAWLDIRNSASLSLIVAGGNINETDTTDNYDATLIHLAEQAETYDVTGLTPNFGTSKYSSAAQTARDYLETTKGWTITDGGLQS